MHDVNDVKKCLTDRSKLAVSVLGVGNAGNQVLEKAEAAGYPVFAINSSSKDLDDTVISKTIPSFIIGSEARGAGKNRQKAQDLLNENVRDLFQQSQFTKMIASSDVVFIVGSTAGGTGSGIAPVLYQMLGNMYPGKIFIYYGIIPKLADSAFAHYNTVECLNELIDPKPKENARIIAPTYLLADLAYYEDIPNEIAYGEVADHIIMSIDTIAGKFLNYSPSGMIDENDMKVIIGQPGYMAIYFLDKITTQMVEKQTVQSMIIQKIKHSPAADILRDGIVKEMGIIINCPEEMGEASKTGNYRELMDYIGTPFASFENYSNSQTVHGQFITMLSGLNVPYTRIAKSTEIYKALKAKQAKQKVIHLGDDLGDGDFMRAQGAADRQTLSAESDGTISSSQSSILDAFLT